MEGGGARRVSDDVDPSVTCPFGTWQEFIYVGGDRKMGRSGFARACRSILEPKIPNAAEQDQKITRQRLATLVLSVVKTWADKDMQVEPRSRVTTRVNFTRTQQSKQNTFNCTGASTA